MGLFNGNNYPVGVILIYIIFSHISIIFTHLIGGANSATVADPRDYGIYPGLRQISGTNIFIRSYKFSNIY